MLIPLPPQEDTFRRNRQRFITDGYGCYALTSAVDQVLYLGLASNLRRRFGQHLDDVQKTALTPLGVAIKFFWIETKHIERIERTWMNIHIEHEGRLPLLNTNYSPTPY